MDAGTGADPAAERRRAYREFVRTHHPDVGGAPDEFIAGLRRFHEPTHAPDGRRYEGQTVFYTRPRGFGRVAANWRSRKERRRRTPRVW
jgi:curved DNA-binding protein CbpA